MEARDLTIGIAAWTAETQGQNYARKESKRTEALTPMLNGINYSTQQTHVWYAVASGMKYPAGGTPDISTPGRKAI